MPPSTPASKAESGINRFGIRVTLAEGNPMALPHLLGNDWHTTHWYATERERDAALRDMGRLLPNYRKGDTPAQVLTKVQR